MTGKKIDRYVRYLQVPHEECQQAARILRGQLGLDWSRQRSSRVSWGHWFEDGSLLMLKLVRGPGCPWLKCLLINSGGETTSPTMTARHDRLPGEHIIVSSQGVVYILIIEVGPVATW